MDAQVVEFIKGIQTGILEIVTTELEADNERVYQDWKVKATLPAAVLATLNYEETDQHRVLPLATNKFEVVARLADLVKQFPYLEPVYDTYAPYTHNKCGTRLPKDAQFCTVCIRFILDPKSELKPVREQTR